jgi:hypothetical protein
MFNIRLLSSAIFWQKGTHVSKDVSTRLQGVRSQKIVTSMFTTVRNLSFTFQQNFADFYPESSSNSLVSAREYCRSNERQSHRIWDENYNRNYLCLAYPMRMYRLIFRITIFRNSIHSECIYIVIIAMDKCNEEYAAFYNLKLNKSIS